MDDSVILVVGCVVTFLFLGRCLFHSRRFLQRQLTGGH